MKIIRQNDNFENSNCFEITKNADALLIGDIYYKNRIFNKYHGWLGRNQWFIANNNKLEDL